MAHHSKPNRCDHSPHQASMNRYDMKGYEREFTVTRQGCARIAHALSVSGPLDLILAQLVPAFRMVLNRHPKTRALMSPKQDDEPLTSYISPPFSMADDKDNAIVDSLVTIIQGETPGNEMEEIRQLIEDACNQTVDRTVQYPYFLTVHVPKRPLESLEKPNDNVPFTMVLFSDHAFGDGYSGIIVLNDILMNIRLLTLLSSQTQVNSDERMLLQSQLDEQCQPLPLRPSLYDQLMDRPTVWKHWLLDMMHAIGKIIHPPLEFQPFLASRKDLFDMNRLPFPLNKTSCLIASGTKENLESALAACRKEQVTLHGAIVACLLMAHVKAKYPDLRAIPNSSVKLHLDVDYNMRHRVKAPFPELTVGANMCIAPLEHYATDGVDVHHGFWDVARHSKRQSDANLASPSLLSEMLFCHINLRVNNTKLNLQAKRGVMSDVNLSNLGRYPFPRIHDLNNLGIIHVKGLHLYNSMPHTGYNAIVFVTSTDHLDYAMANRMSDQDGGKLFLYMVQFIEAISTIGKEETMVQACERMLAV